MSIVRDQVDALPQFCGGHRHLRISHPEQLHPALARFDDCNDRRLLVIGHCGRIMQSSHRFSREHRVNPELMHREATAVEKLHPVIVTITDPEELIFDCAQPHRRGE